MSCGCTSSTGDCSEALTQLRTCTAQKVYGTTRALDEVDGALLEQLLREIIEKQNAIATALENLLNEDCTLKDGIVTCRSLNEEIGVSCLTG